MLHLLRVVLVHARPSAGVWSAGPRGPGETPHWMADSNQFYIALGPAGGRRTRGR